MKKGLYLAVIMITALCFVFISGCSEATNWEPTNYEQVNDVDGIKMTVKEGTVSSTGLTAVIENNSGIDCAYSEAFLLKKKIRENWYKVPVINENYGFDDIGYILTPGESMEWNVDWGWLYGSLDAGEYRIVKIIAASKMTENIDKFLSSDSNQHILAAEFVISSDEKQQ